MARPPAFPAPPKSGDKLYPLTVDAVDYLSRKHRGTLYIDTLIGNQQILINVTLPQLNKVARDLDKHDIHYSCYVGKDDATNFFLKPLLYNTAGQENTQTRAGAPQATELSEPNANPARLTPEQFDKIVRTMSGIAALYGSDFHTPSIKTFPTPDYTDYESPVLAKRAYIFYNFSQFAINQHHYLEVIELDPDDKDLRNMLDRDEIEALAEIEDQWHTLHPTTDD